VYFGLLLILTQFGVAESEKRVAAIFLLPVWALEPPKRSFLPYSGSYSCLIVDRRLEMLRNPRLRPRRSCVCAVAQYAVLAANASQWERPIFALPPLRNPSTNVDVMSNILLRPPQGVNVQNLVGIDSAVTDLRMREKHDFVWIFLST